VGNLQEEKRKRQGGRLESTSQQTWERESMRKRVVRVCERVRDFIMDRTCSGLVLITCLR
jgi:hypothetical protein